MVFIKGHPKPTNANSYKKGHIGYWKDKDYGPWSGKKRGPQKDEQKIKLSEHHKRYGIKPPPTPENDSNPIWKGDRASYQAKHMWIYRRKGKALKCIACEILGKKRYHWANVSGKYKRDVNDYIELCPSCHYYYDHGILKI